MAAEHITPTDEVTGLPLPIRLPQEYLERTNIDRGNWHHHFHPASAPRLQSLGGKALRSCRMQYVPGNVHNMRAGSYHSIFAGPELPDTTDKQFLLCVLAAAGYMPDKVIDIESDDPTIPYQLSATERSMYQARRLPTPVAVDDVHSVIKKFDGIIGIRDAYRRATIRSKRQAAFSYAHFRYTYDPLKDFFTDYLLDQEVDISARTVRRFLSTNDEVKQQAIGDTILAQTARQATDEFRSVYMRLQSSGALHPLMPDKPEKLVFRKLGNFEQRAALLPALRDQLAAVA